MSELIDAHVHVWDPSALTYRWLAQVGLDRPHLPADVDRADGATSAVVFVQAGALPTQALAEARWVDGLDWAQLRGIVAAADLAAYPADRAAHLDALSGIGRVVGVRHLLQDLPVETFPDFVPGLRDVAQRGFVFDACVRHPQMTALVELRSQVPELRMVLDHLGKPPVDAGIDSDEGATWARRLEELAAYPDTAVKLSGMTAESTDPAAFERNTDDFLAHAMSVFGPERAMIGSDWPVSAHLGVGGRFADWCARVRRVVGEAAWPEVSHRSAQRWYRLPS